MILSAGDARDLIHHGLDDAGNCVIVFVCGFSVLEVDVGILRRACLMRMFGVEGTCAETVDIVKVDEGLDFVVVDDVDFADFVRGSETVEEVYERYGGFEGGKMCHKAQVHNFLNGVGREHSKAGLTASHNVRVVAEDAECVSGESSCGNVENAGEKFARDFVHIGNHQQQTLACGEGGGHRACGERTVNRTCRAGFGLHFGDFKHVAQYVFSALTRPFVAVFSHGRGGRNGVNCRNVGERIRDMRRSGITVDSHLFHKRPP